MINSEGIAKQCEKILTAIDVDFVGLALQNKEGPDVRWHFAAGNSNEKYKRITVRYGKGIAGKVISTGSPITIKNFPEEITGKALEYPIMLAEKLVYAFAVPLFIKSVPKGVLLVGRRSNTPIAEKEQLTVKQAAKGLESLF
ncbi:GAF domain-containing protein [Bacillus sp. DTU_2020_1000418_1_SI_GHA_SEK_038]|uniref:GAF domain-containing protein n=1 Tax=Bacillus sp. DTU_2020_1000418_1_SI_GHA_SEK_038 TaxID=3077585 RepID=UPI0028EE7A51|nr:GAF domain-containing protein [Bacillus sp. DTU_2020_1000418_1_SI_GHA_SEK_038]WNS73785.1 GAF domain-containing protein [Bacillus sp. DTU_2020_1000418_1_SI_GHA_SEK_038]